MKRSKHEHLRPPTRQVSPNMGAPLLDCSLVASSWMMSQCSARMPFSIRTMSATNPRGRKAVSRKTAVDNDIVPFSQDGAVLPLQRRGSVSNQIEKPLSPRPNMGAMLDVFRRPELLRSGVVSLVEQDVKCLDSRSSTSPRRVAGTTSGSARYRTARN
jgi:hypothetical protein